MAKYRTVLIFVCLLVVTISSSKKSLNTKTTNLSSRVSSASLHSPNVNVSTGKLLPTLPLLKSLEDFCKLFGVPKANCTCAYVRKGDPNNQFCIVSPTPKLVKKNTTVIYDVTLERTRASVTVVATVVAIVGNTLVLSVSIWKRANLSQCKTLIAILAACDLLFAILQFIMVVPSFWTSDWLFGTAMCKLLSGINTLGAFLAMGIIFIIAIERYMGIVIPFSRGISKNLTYILLAVNLVIGSAFIIPEFITYDVIDDIRRCQETWTTQSSLLIYHYFVLLLLYVTPGCIIVFLYARIIMALRKQVQGNSEMAMADQRLKEQRLKDNKRIMKILVCLLTSFLVLVLPNRIVVIILGHLVDPVTFVSIIPTSTYQALKYIALIPYPLHVAVNPIIYSLVDRQWRKDISQMICKCVPKSIVSDSSKSTDSTGISLRTKTSHLSKMSLSKNKSSPIINIHARNTKDEQLENNMSSDATGC